MRIVRIPAEPANKFEAISHKRHEQVVAKKAIFAEFAVQRGLPGRIMDRFVRLMTLLVTVFALSGVHGTDAVPGDDVRREESFFVQEREQEDADWCNRVALNDGGLEFSAARPVSSASRVRSFADERNNSPQQHSRTVFLRSGKIVCMARRSDFMPDRITNPVSGAVAGLAAAVALERLRI